MISLQDSRWTQLRHAYGEASGIPPLLRAVAADPSDTRTDSGPWHELWSALCHQGDIYPASFAAVPHIVSILASSTRSASYHFFLFPASIEVARHQSRFEIPADLVRPYRESLDQIPALAAAVSDRDWAGSFGRCVLAAVAASKQCFSAAELLLEIDDADLAQVLEWYSSR